VREVVTVMRTLQLIIILLFITITVVYSYLINITVTVPIEKYAISEAFPDIVHVSVLLSGETNPHYIPFRLSMIKIVERSQIYVPLWHFPIEYRLAELIKNRITILTLEDYKREGLIFLNYPGTNIPDTHGWWLDPDNMLALITALYKKMLDISTDRMEIEKDYKIFVKRILQLNIFLRDFGKIMKRECKNVIIICANPATLYVVHDLGLDCVVVREGENINAIKSINMNRPILVLLASFQRGTKIDWFYRTLVRKHPGTIEYLDILGSVNVNITYTGLLYNIAGKLYGACIALSHVQNHHVEKSSNSDLIYVTYVLSVLLAICVIVILSMLRRGYRF